MAEPLLLTPNMPGDDVGAVTTALSGAFAEIRAALDAERPVAVLVDAADLEGQGKPADAAVATGLLGMVRTLAIEGAKPGWQVNVVALDDYADARLAGTVAALVGSPVTGQLLQLGGANLGKVVP